MTLLADGTLDILTDTDIDKISFTYQVESTDGASNVLGENVGFVTGTMIRTGQGDTPRRGACRA